MNIESLKKKNVLILGAGKTGIATASFLLSKVNKLLLSESKDKPGDIRDKINFLEKSGLETEFGGNTDAFIKKVDLIIISPGISPYSDIVKKINSFQIPIISEIELAKNFTRKPIIAVTGTNGKTTTTSLITHLINASGKKAVPCGNIGHPFCGAVVNDKNIDYYVLEISSFQIFYSPTFTQSCNIAVCLNITPDHIDWHGDFNHYIETKKKLFSGQKEGSWAVLNFADNIIKDFAVTNNKFYFSTAKTDITKHDYFAYFEDNILKVKEKNNIQSIINRNELQILGLHNIENALASIATLRIINTDTDIIKAGLSSFQGVEHRIEFVKKVGNKEFYNDSKATNPEATIKAIEAFDKKMTLILGGRDKKTNLSEMIDVIKNHVTEVILYGEAKERFLSELNKNNYKNLKIVINLEEAVRVSLNSKTEIVLFSPACSSFDMFKNYEERGKLFKELVGKL